MRSGHPPPCHDGQPLLLPAAQPPCTGQSEALACRLQTIVKRVESIASCLSLTRQARSLIGHRRLLVSFARQTKDAESRHWTVHLGRKVGMLGGEH